jgi:aqualysin 1
MRRALWALPLAALAACEPPTITQRAAVPEHPAAASAGLSASLETRDRYIVVFRSGVSDAPGLARRLVQEHGGTLHHTYRSALRGFAATLPPAAARALANHPHVAFIEQDQVVRASTITQSGATWGLDRIDQRTPGLNGAYTYDYTGAGVTAYVLDTGIRYTHQEFTDRVYYAFDGVGDGESGWDCNGHGTHVAGTIGGTTYGVAKGVDLAIVRVLNCEGDGLYSWIIAGVDWVTANHVKPAVANMSLGGPASDALDQAVRNSIAAGVTYVVAAGNESQDACNVSPARTPEAITVGATTWSDSRAWFSNFGRCVDWYAPGDGITSAWAFFDDQPNTISGTSMASPHVAGVAALLLEAVPGASPDGVRRKLSGGLTRGIVTGANDTTNNHLLFSRFEMVTPNLAPLADFAFSCTELACGFSDLSGDVDGTVSGWSWSFGDGVSSTAKNPSHSYAVRGTYSVSLTARDDQGATHTATRSVTVTAPFVLSGRGYRSQGTGYTDLSWSGAATATVDVYRNGVKVATTANDGFYTDTVDGRGTFVYKLCEAGSTFCSNEVTR